MKPHYQIPRYDAYIPEQPTCVVAHHPVIVVGGGLVGLALALDLAMREVPVVVLDDDNTVGVRGLASRGLCYAKRTLEVFDRLGIYDRIKQKGVTWRVGKVFDCDRELYSFDLQRESEVNHPPFVNIQQFYIEQYLVERIQKFPHAQIRWCNRVSGVKQSRDKVTVDVELPDGQYQLTCDYLVGCDGAHSTVRKSLGIEVSIEGGNDTWLIIDFWLNSKLPNERCVWIRNNENEGRAVWFHQAADQVWRLDCQIGDREVAQNAATESVAVEKVRRLLHPILGEPLPDFELVDVGPWTYRTYVLDNFRHGRVLLAGDAAHLKSPFGARGGNSGIQDADNLGWKLALILRGKGSEKLLDTYADERREAALENVRVTKGTARFLDPRSDFERLLRDTTMHLASFQPFARALVNGGRMSVANVYHSSSALIADGPSEAGMPLQVSPGCAALNGAVAVRGRLAHLLDYADNTFLAILFADRADAFADVSRELEALVARPVPIRTVIVTPGDDVCGDIPVLKDQSGTLRTSYGAENNTVYLLRPDMHVAWRSRAFNIAELCGAVYRVVQCNGNLVTHDIEIHSSATSFTPNLENADLFYQQIEKAVEGRQHDESMRFIIMLAFILANQIGRAADLTSAINAAQVALGGSEMAGTCYGKPNAVDASASTRHADKVAAGSN